MPGAGGNKPPIGGSKMPAGGKPLPGGANKMPPGGINKATGKAVPPPPPKTRKKKRLAEDEYGAYASRNQALQKPMDQERLNEQELKEEFIRSLTATDPDKMKSWPTPDNKREMEKRVLVVWDGKEKNFAEIEDIDEMFTVFSLESELLMKDSDELAEFPGELIDEFSDPEVEDLLEVELPKEKDQKQKKLQPGTDAQPKTEESKTDQALETEGQAGEEEGEEKEEKEEPAPVTSADKPKKLLNQFNFCERGAQTTIYHARDKISQTEPPPRAVYKDMCNLWIIYDAYIVDAANRPVVKKKVIAGGGDDDEGGDEGEKKEVEEKPKEVKKKDISSEVRIVEREKVKMRKPSILEGQSQVDMALLNSAEGLKYMERLVNANMHEEVVEDFKYFEDNADEYRETGEGTLLPLWKFSYDRAKKMHATCISWSLRQPDYFAVSYGSFSFINPILDGMVVLYTIKNPSYPEHAWLAPKGAMACHIHPLRSCLICVGLYDGNVAVLNVERNEENESRAEIFRNIPTAMKHHAPAWSVKWGGDDLDGDPTFFSAGMDGRVILWKIGVQDVYGNGGLEGTEVCTLYLPVPAITGPDGTTYKLFGCARCLAFHPTEKNTFLVGTAEGNIFQCCTLYSSRFDKLYNAHFLPVAALQWNHFHSDVFISCSEDWTIKVWDRTDSEPMYVFEIGVPILDVCWAPYSSTVFGTVTEEGKVLIYDLNVNKEKPICTQQVVTKRKVRPHRIEFNPIYPIVVVADDRGHLTSLKLSPNLRVLPKDTRNLLLEGEAKAKFEINKMARLLSLVRDPDSVTSPKEVPEPTDLEHSGQPKIEKKC